jgi:hypothetical protein
MKKYHSKKVTLLLAAATLATQFLFANTANIALASESANSDDSFDESLAQMFIEMIENDADYCTRNATVADRILESNDLERYYGIFTNHISSAKSTKNDLVNSFGVPSDSQSLVKIDSLIITMQTALVDLAKNSFIAVSDSSSSANIQVVIDNGNKTISYLTDTENLDSNHELVQGLSSSIDAFKENFPNIVATEASNKLDVAIKSESFSEIKKSLSFIENAKNTLITEYNLDLNSKLIQNLEIEAENANQRLPEFLVTDTINQINDAIASKEYSKLEIAKAHADASKTMLIEDYRLAPDSSEVIRLNYAISRIDRALNGLDDSLPISSAIEKIDAAIASGKYTYLAWDESKESYIELMDAAKNALKTREELIKDSYSPQSESIRTLDQSIQSLASPLVNSIMNQVSSVLYQMSGIHLKELYEAGQNAQDLKKLLIDDLNFTEDSNTIINLEQQITYLKRDASSERLLEHAISTLEDAYSSESISEMNDALEEVSYAQKHLLYNFNYDSNNQMVKDLFDEMVKVKQKKVGLENIDSPTVPLISNPNWYSEGMPEKILVREQVSRPETVIIDLVAKERMAIQNDRIEFLDRKEDDIFTETTHFWPAPGSKWDHAVGFIGPDGVLVESFDDIPDCPQIASGDVVFSIVFETGGPFYDVPKLVNRSYWKLVKETRVGSTGSSVNLTESLTTGTSETETTSLAKTVSTSLDFGTKIGVTAGAGGHQGAPSGGVSSDFSVGSSISNSLSSTFGRSFTVSSQEQVAIRQNFETNGLDRKVALYQYVEEFEKDFYPDDSENDFLRMLKYATNDVLVSPRVRTQAVLPTEHHTTVDISEEEIELSSN